MEETKQSLSDVVLSMLKETNIDRIGPGESISIMYQDGDGKLHPVNTFFPRGKRGFFAAAFVAVWNSTKAEELWGNELVPVSIQFTSVK